MIINRNVRERPTGYVLARFEYCCRQCSELTKSDKKCYHGKDSSMCPSLNKKDMSGILPPKEYRMRKGQP
jgi:hypothetical protein